VTSKNELVIPEQVGENAQERFGFQTLKAATLFEKHPNVRTLVAISTPVGP